jgi:hypothetical protein
MTVSSSRTHTHSAACTLDRRMHSSPTDKRTLSDNLDIELILNTAASNMSRVGTKGRIDLN